MKGVYKKNGEITEVYIGNGITEIFPEEIPTAQPEQTEEAWGWEGETFAEDETQNVFQGLRECDGITPQADIWAGILRGIRREENMRKYRRRAMMNRIRRAVVPVLAVIAIILLAITPDSYDLLPAGTRPTMLIIVAIAAAAYLALMGIANSPERKKK